MVVFIAEVKVKLMRMEIDKRARRRLSGAILG